MKKAVVLLSGGLDSATCLAIAHAEGYDCYALSVDYGQRHVAELRAARLIAATYHAVEHRVVSLDMGQFGGSALTDASIAVPAATVASNAIPVTYVPARNTVFLALALGYAESIGAMDLFIGANQVDYSGYPDCREAFLNAFEALANVATKAGVSGQAFHLHAPLLHLTKAEIICRGLALGVDYALTTSCYQLDASGAACGICESCVLRQQGFEAAHHPDPTRYQNT